MIYKQTIIIKYNNEDWTMLLGEKYSTYKETCNKLIKGTSNDLVGFKLNRHQHFLILSFLTF